MGLQAGTTTLEINLTFLRNLEVDPFEDLARPLLDIYPNDVQSCYRGKCSTMFTVAVNIRKWETIQMFLNRIIDTENVAYLQNVILFSY